MLDLNEEQGLSLYILYYWKFQDTDLFFKAGYDFDTSFLRQKFMQESIFRNVPPRIPDMVKLRDELAKLPKIDFKTALDVFHGAAFDQSEENKEKFVQENLDLDNKSDEDLIRSYIDHYYLKIPDSEIHHYETLYDLVQNMYAEELKENSIQSIDDKTIFIIEKMSEELQNYIYAYGLQHDFRILQMTKTKNSLRQELQIFENHFVPIFKSWMDSQMEREDLAMMTSNILLYYSRVKRKSDYFDDLYKLFYGEKGTKKAILASYAQEKYQQIKTLKLKPLLSEKGKVNRVQFLAELFKTLGYVKQVERKIFGIPFQPEIVEQETIKKWLKYKV